MSPGKNFARTARFPRTARAFQRFSLSFQAKQQRDKKKNSVTQNEATRPVHKKLEITEILYLIIPQKRLKALMAGYFKFSIRPVP